MGVPSQQNNPGLQDDHDPSDIAQQQNNKRKPAADSKPAVASESNAFKVPKTPAGPYDRDTQAGNQDKDKMRQE